MKKAIILLTLLIFSLYLFSQPVDVSTAKQVGKNFLIAKTEWLKQKSSVQLRLVYQSASQQKDAGVYYYVFNVDSSGFIIVSGSRNTLPILAYSTSGTYNPNNVPPNMKGMLDIMQKDIAAAMDNEMTATEKINRQWNELVSGQVAIQKGICASVSPLLGNLQWNQSPYYNDSCPYDYTEDDYCPTGCAATAMAQIIRYWEYPINGIGSHCYYADYASDGYGDYGLQCADFENTTYNYDLMPDYIDDYSTSAEISAVAQLMYHCGVSIQMKYGPTQSGAYSIIDDYWIQQGEMDVRTAFKQFWGYSKARGIKKADYSDEQWKQILKEQLNKRQPVYFSGRSPDDLSGHAFVCDGYDDNDFFHFNWGWGGLYNCYCPIDSLVPGGIGTGGGHGNYTYSQQAIIDLRGENEEKSLGWKGSFDHVNYFGNSTIDNAILLPDSCQRSYFPDGSSKIAAEAHAIGCIYNPYAQTFGADNDESLLNKNITYRLDTLRIEAGYILGKSGYNAVSPDTLRVFLSYYEPYSEVKKDTDYRYLYYTGYSYQDLLCPKIQANNYTQQKGSPIKPVAANTVTIDYILTEEDTSILDWNSSLPYWDDFYYSNIRIPLTYNHSTVNGFEIPAGAVLSTMVKFIPGYNYQNNDTLRYVNSDSYWVYPDNHFRIKYGYTSSMSDYLDNSNEYNNGALMEYTNTRYQLFDNFLDSCYYPNPSIIPFFYYYISYNTRPTGSRQDIDTLVCESFEWDGNTYTSDEDLKFTYTDIEGKDSIIFVHLSVDAMPGSIDNINGTTNLPTSGVYTYSISPVAGATEYVWTFSNPNWLMTQINDTSVSVNATGYGSGTLQVKAFTDKRKCETRAFTKINYCMPLGSMGEIQGPASVKTSGTYMYSVTPVENASYYQWSLNGADWPFIGSLTGPSITINIESGATATLSVKAFDECGDFTERSFNILSKVGIVESSIADAINISPNPTEDKINVYIPEGKATELLLIDVFGKQLFKQNVTGEKTQLDISSYAPGVYFLSVKDKQGLIGTYKVVKR